MSNLTNIFKFLFPLQDFLYILQLEEYDTSRYLKHFSRRLFKTNFQIRSKLVYTARIKLQLTLIIFSFLIIFIALFFHLGLVSLIFLFFSPVLVPNLVAVTNMAINPFFNIFKKIKIKQANFYFTSHYKKTKVIAITGSYGKTTTKYALEACLQFNYKVAIIPDNINTSLGIANYILNKQLPEKTDFLIVEMGAYEIGDIALTTKVVQPNISILTCLGDQHLERFGSFANLVNAKNEIFTYSCSDALKFVATGDLKVLKDYNLKTDDLIEVKIDKNADRNLELASVCAEALGVSKNIIEDNLNNFKLPERRNHVFELAGVTVIDNSYNISPQTALYNLKKAAELACRTKKDLVVMTGGIAEQGNETASVNLEFGAQLDRYASRVILHPSIYKTHITKTLTKPYVVSEKALVVIKNITNFIDPETEILLQFPELTDLSY
jgi:UDP-N-acetylmuramoyl-tripeptide--D-alanyl-D-alanine ligase